MPGIKETLRRTLRTQRCAVANKAAASSAIIKRLVDSEDYRSNETLLCYAANRDEIDLDAFIRKALSDGKRVAVPYCLDSSGTMEFYLIDALEQLREGRFGIREPDINYSKRLENFDKSIIIVPAIAFDRKGYRIGYGKGYYDRFLAAHNTIPSVGVCFEAMLQEQLHTENYDVPIDMIITEHQTIYCNNGGKNG